MTFKIGYRYVNKKYWVYQYAGSTLSDLLRIVTELYNCGVVEKISITKISITKIKEEK